MSFVNLTPHAVVIFNKDEEVHTRNVDSVWAKVIPPSGLVARVQETTSILGYSDGVEIAEVSRCEVRNLPLCKQNTYFIVSSIVAETLRGERSDLVFPIDFVRDANGKILGCYRLGKLSTWPTKT